MTAKTVQLIDQSRNVLATAHVADEGTHFWGSIELERKPEALHQLFSEFEVIVNGQMLSFLDEI